MKKKVLAIGAHIDDIEIGCGGTLIQHKEACDNIVLCVLKADETRTGDPEERAKEQMRAAKILNAETFLFKWEMSISDVVEQLDRLGATYLYMPYIYDYHQDHLRAYQVGMAVARNVGITVMYYLTVTSFNYYPNIFRKIDLRKKIELVKCFKSQLKHRPKHMEIMVKQNEFFGALLPGLGHAAEGFIFHRRILNDES